MDQKKFKLLLYRTLVVPIVLLALLAGVLLWQTNYLRSSLEWVDQTDQVIAVAQHLLSLMVDMEAGLRGYLLTGNEEFLQPYYEAQQNIGVKFGELSRMVADNPREQVQVAAMRDICIEWQQYAEQVLEMRRAGGDYATYEVNVPGKRLMESMRVHRDNLLAIEEDLRDERSRSAAQASRAVTLSCVLLTLGIGGLLAAFTRRQLRLLATQFNVALEAAESRAAILARSEQRWVTTLSSIGDAVIATDSNGKITFMNAVAQRLSGWKQDEANGKAVDEVFRVVSEDTGSALDSPIAMAIRLDSIVELANHAVLLGRNGTRVPVEDSAAPIRDSDGKMNGVVLVFRDVTERRNKEHERAELLQREHIARRAAEENASKLRKVQSVTEAALAHAPGDILLKELLRRTADALGADFAAILLLNEETKMLEARATLGFPDEIFSKARIPLGKSVAGLIAKKGRMHIIPDLKEIADCTPALRDKIASLVGVPLVVEDRVIGVMHVDSVKPRNFTREEGELLQMVADRVALAIDRARREEALRATEQRWATTLGSIGDAVISTDAVGRVVFMNDTAQTLTGWPLAEAKGKDLDAVFEIISERTRMKPESPISQVIRMNKVVGLANHTVLIRRDRTEIPIEDSAAPIRDTRGEIDGVVLVFHDVTEQKKAAEVLRSSERLATMGRMAASIAHEIHNPLDTVGNLLYMIHKGNSDPEITRKYAELAGQELGRVVQMTKHMLAFNRPAMKPVPVRIGEVLESVVGLFERRIESAAIKLVTRIEYGDQITAYPSEMRQVFANLVGNAIDAVGLKGTIVLHAFASRDWRNGRQGLRVVVADNGPGIQPGIRGRIFEPFFSTKGEAGTGLGLWIIRGILEKHEGIVRMWSSTQKAHSGTCFAVFFPFESGAEAGKGNTAVEEVLPS